MNSLDQAIAKGYMKGDMLSKERAIRYVNDQKSDKADAGLMAELSIATHVIQKVFGPKDSKQYLKRG